MIINGVTIDETFAEAFPMKATRVIITAHTDQWAWNSARSMTGFATSVIGCGCEADIERKLDPSETPDGRPGYSAMLFAMNKKTLMKQLETRAGQTVLTSPGSALFSGIDGGERIPLGKNLRYFGDGFQTSKLINKNRYWRIPVMDGEFIAEETTGRVNAIGGGNLLVMAETLEAALTASEKAVDAMRTVPNIILPFPGGVVRSGSKVGSKYAALHASTNDAFCPTLKGVTNSQLSPDIESVLEIVIDGLTEQDINNAMRIGIETFCSIGAYNGIKRISAGNYGGKLGPYHFHLREIMQ
ncbi:MAG: formylmethanofuran--tetrahydromethanopterin N-formyltransferase [Gammaproteobacteria bacterium]|nr:formylmethanofuran--tetrahydromethanopterin N-formyltransferase [Gammaproteobacteria bacterium]